jgi:hypothetical protein
MCGKPREGDQGTIFVGEQTEKGMVKKDRTVCEERMYRETD